MRDVECMTLAVDGICHLLSIHPFPYTISETGLYLWMRLVSTRIVLSGLRSHRSSPYIQISG